MRRERVFAMAAILALAALVLACGSSANPSAGPSGTAGAEQTAGQTAAEQTAGQTAAEQTAGPPTVEDPRVERALALRSVQMELTTTFPGEEPTRVLASVDAAGNQLIETRLPLAGGSTVSTDSPDANVLEIYVIDGAAYSRVGKEGPAESSPEQADALHRMLYNPAGPGLWLELLSEGSLQAAGSETTGGFAAAKYTVDGPLEEGTIRGTIWLEEGTETLVGADLAVSESLFYPPGSGRTGTVDIRLSVGKADVPAIALPEA
jgi:hypothetical protein